jgi:two-component system cell cycle sensor histidine kinase/response regulator CckA
MKTILVVDNHPVMLQFMVQLLEKKNYEVLTAPNGLAALDVLKDHAPDIMFIDLVMPNIDGADLCRIVRKMPKFDKTHLVILSAIAAEQPTNLEHLGVSTTIAKGPLNRMGNHILEVLDQIEKGDISLEPGKIKGLEGVYARNITKELLSIKKHFQVVLESMNEGIVEIAADGRIVYSNPVAAALAGLPQEKLLASHFADVFEGSDREKINGILEALEPLPEVSEQPPRTEEKLVAEIKGKQLEISICPLQSNENKAIAIIVDITEKRRFELQLKEAQRLESIGTLAAGVAHDFNNLLMGIQGNASMMLMDVNESHPHYERLTMIQNQIERAKQLTNQLLGYARKGKYKVQLFNLNSLIEETAETFGHTKKEITIHMDLAQDLLEIEADLGQIEQILLNLFVNAADAMPRGGDLRIKTGNVTDREIVSGVYSAKRGNYLMLEVSDNGIGMDEETQQRVFEPFFSTKEMGRGTGLGLASVYGTVKGHGGYIEVKSEKHKGSTFRIYLPVTSLTGRKPARPKQRSIHPETERGLILLVDDEADILKVGRDLLKALDYEVIAVASGREALDVYSESQSTIALVILDIVMPRMGGGETYDRLKAIDPSVKVLLCSGYSIEGEVSRIMERGADGFIQKPFTLQTLNDKIRTVLKEEKN